MTRDGLPPTFTPFPRLPTELKIRIWRAFPDLKEKIRSLAVEFSSVENLETLLIAIKRLSPRKLREIILIVGQTGLLKLSQFKYPEHVRFSELDSPSWQIWKDATAGELEGCVVRVVEAKVVF